MLHTIPISTGYNQWVVYILGEGIGHKIGLTGLFIMTLSNTFNIHSFYNSECLFSWKRNETTQSGCIGSLVFLEITCYGEPLWMQHPMAKSIQEQLTK